MKLFHSRFLVIMTVAFLVSCLIVTPQTVEATVTIIQPSSADTYIKIDAVDGNYGAEDLLFVQSGDPSFIRRTLVKFDLSSIPSGSAVSVARLKLRNCYTGFGITRVYTANRLTTDWVELQATWNSYQTGSSWTTPGGDFTTDGAASVAVTYQSGGYWVIWDVTAIVKAWIEGGQPNYGFLIRDPNDGATFANDFNGFVSRDSSSSSLRPILEVEWLPFDFSLSAEGGLAVTQGGSGSNTITVNLVSGLTKPVSLSVSGLPPGASASFNPQSGNPTFTSILTITTSASTPPGSYMITVTGTGSQSQSTTFTLTVNPASKPVGGLVMPTNKLEIATPYLALAALIAAVSAVVVVKRRGRD